jgi:hypothetical protein
VVDPHFLVAEFGCGIRSSDDHLEGGRGLKGKGERVADSSGFWRVERDSNIQLSLNRPCNGCGKAFIAGIPFGMTKVDIGKSGIICKC